jgi:diketogulonate reductase-like aldo/keto reductase
VQQNIVVIPKAASLHYLKDNLCLFDFSLSKKEMKEIEGLDQNKRFSQPDQLIED